MAAADDLHKALSNALLNIAVELQAGAEALHEQRERLVAEAKAMVDALATVRAGLASGSVATMPIVSSQREAAKVEAPPEPRRSPTERAVTAVRELLEHAGLNFVDEKTIARVAREAGLQSRSDGGVTSGIIGKLRKRRVRVQSAKEARHLGYHVAREAYGYRIAPPLGEDAARAGGGQQHNPAPPPSAPPPASPPSANPPILPPRLDAASARETKPRRPYSGAQPSLPLEDSFTGTFAPRA